MKDVELCVCTQEPEREAIACGSVATRDFVENVSGLDFAIKRDLYPMSVYTEQTEPYHKKIKTIFE